MDNITFRRAGAGSGKTYEVTQKVAEALRDGSCRPSGLIATTFTRKAATELRERLRTGLYEAGMTAQAEQLGQALIGTVHSVAEKILRRFALEAGISPRIQILEEDAAAVLLSRALEAVADIEETERLQEIARRLEQEDWQTRGFKWKRQVSEILDHARANGYSPEDLRRFGAESVDQFLAFFGEPDDGAWAEPLPGLLASARAAIEAWGNTTKTTNDYLAVLDDFKQSLEMGCAPWGRWLKALNSEPAKRGRPETVDLELDGLKEALGRWANHPQLHEDIRSYTTTVFDLAARALGEFSRLKEERGVLDFTDLEQRARDLVCDNAEVAAQLGESLDLLVVDEFQDTSPMQLSLFVELSKRAKRVVWVGDVKQAIYGFRNSDPGLIDAVVARLSEEGRVADPLNVSYRSVPGLVRLANEWFAEPFQESLDLAAEEVCLEEHRDPISDGQPFLGILNLDKETSGGRWCNQHTDGALADGIVQLIRRKPTLKVFDQNERQERELRLSDIAVLCRTNKRAKAVAEALGARGIPASLAGSGLASTPEVCYGLACLRRLFDPRDTLAVAEIIALAGNREPEAWLAERLDYLRGLEAEAPDHWGAEGGTADPRIAALDQARAAVDTLSITEALDMALDCGDAFAVASAWPGPSARAAERRANLETLRGVASRYEDSASAKGSPATIGGFLAWLRQLAAAGQDVKASALGDEAVQVMTYHKAKGLEWPVVVCAELDSDSTPRLFSPRVEQAPGQALDMEAPLAGRHLRFWASPFGAKRKGIEILDQIRAGEVGEALNKRERGEALRLLYVGLTRARDLLVLARRKGKPHPWLEQVDIEKLNTAAADAGAFEIDAIAPDNPEEGDGGDERLARRWFPGRQGRTAKLRARLAPSSLSAAEPLATGEIVRFENARLELKGRPDDALLGDALHGVLAAEFQSPGRNDASDLAGRVLAAHGLAGALAPAAVARMADDFRHWTEKRFQPTSALVECPFHYHNEQGQLVSGFIDLLLETPEGWVIIDHKTYPGPSTDWPAKAQSYSGQIRAYAAALEATNRPVVSAWIHFAVGGGIVGMNLTD